MKHLIIASMIAITLGAAHRVIPPFSAAPVWRQFTREEQSVGVEKRIGHFQLTNASLPAAVEQLRKVSNSKIVLDAPEQAALTEITFDFHDVSLATLLDCVASSSALRWSVHQGVYHIGPSSTSATTQPILVRRIYDVRDIIEDTINVSAQHWHVDGSQSPQYAFNKWIVSSDPRTLSLNMAKFELLHLITQTIAPDAWIDAGGAYGDATIFDGRLLVTQTEENHRDIAALLHMLQLQPNQTHR